MSDKRAYELGGRLTRGQRMELDACTGCGECLARCPVQEVTGDASISPPEKIGMFREFLVRTRGLKARLTGGSDIEPGLLEDFLKAVYECTTCGACGEACPAGVFTQRLWPALRREMVLSGLGPMGAQGDIPGHVERTGNIYGKPALDRFAPWFPEGIKPVERAPLAYYAGCTGCYESQPMVRGDALVLGAMGEPFTMLPPEEEVCCGFPLFITGQHEMLEGLVRRLVAAYEARGTKTLLCSCPCCINIMARDWPLLYGGPLPFKVRHITQYVNEALARGALRIPEGGPAERLIYHDPCYLSRGVGVTEEPRRILRSIPGVELLEFRRNREDSRCCGAGGAARKVFHENAMGMGRVTIREAVEGGAQRLIISCPACHAKLHEAMRGYEHRIPITDIMEYLAGRLAGGGG